VSDHTRTLVWLHVYVSVTPPLVLSAATESALLSDFLDGGSWAAEAPAAAQVLSHPPPPIFTCVPASSLAPTKPQRRSGGGGVCRLSQPRKRLAAQAGGPIRTGVINDVLHETGASPCDSRPRPMVLLVRRHLYVVPLGVVHHDGGELVRLEG
jgi:hypothetical protein